MGLFYLKRELFLFFLLAVNMASDGNLKTWVSDKLMSLLGYSQSTLVQYVIGLCKLLRAHTAKLFSFFPLTKKYGNFGFIVAKQATSSADVVSKLVEFGLSSSSETRAFAEEIFNRVPHKASGLSVSFLLGLSELRYHMICVFSLQCGL